MFNVTSVHHFRNGEISCDSIMKITINGKAYEVYEYDDDNAILEKYSISQDSTLPSFFRVDNKDFIIASGVALQVSDVRNVIGDLSEEDLNDPSKIEAILLSYPKLKKRDLGVLWILQNYKLKDDVPVDTINIEFLRGLDRISFLTPAKAASTVADFVKRVKKERDQIAEKRKAEKKIFETLDKLKPLPDASPFMLEDITSQSVLKLPNGENLVDIFDAMEASKNIPFIILARKKKIYYKVFRHIIPPSSWIDFVPPFEGIFFKVLNMPPSKLSSRQIMLENLYSDGIWTVDNRVEIEFKVRGGISEDDIKERVFGSLGDRLEHEIVMTRQTSIKGVFTINDINFDRSVFADLVGTNEYFRYFLFFNEKNKPILSKPRFYVYYSPDQQGVIPNSLALTITPQLNEGKSSVIVRVSHATNFQQANSARIITSKLFGLYLQQYDEIVGIYSKLIDNFTSQGDGSKKKEKKEDKKTGPRVAALRKVHPDMFGSRYPDQCQKERQPYVLANEEAARKRAEELGDPHKVMEFEGTWYACEPREPYLDPNGRKDKNDRHVFPGLKENEPKTNDTEYDKEFRRKFPDLVCCFSIDQYEKRASRLRKYREGLEKGEGKREIEAPGKEAGAGYVVGANKRLQTGRFGEVPFNWGKLLHHLGIEKITRGKQSFYPILRYGVLPSPDSFIHCLERAFNPRYVGLTNQEKKILVSDIRKELSESNLAVARQELFDYTEEDIRAMLLDNDEYLAPESYVSLLQKKYECNIFIYVVSDAYPSGNIVVPRSSQAHLTRDIDEIKKTVLVVKYETETDDFPYQCEIFCQVDARNPKKLNFVFENSPIAKIAVKMFYDANEVFVVSTDGYEPYRPVPELTS